MANMEELLQRTTIAFEFPLKEEAFERLLTYFVQAIEGFRVDYSKDTKGRFVQIDKPVQGTIIQEERIARYSGMMTSLSKDQGLRMATFECFFEPLQGPRNLCKDGFYGLKFSTAPGYDLGELPESEISLMDEVRKKTQEFFKSINE